MFFTYILQSKKHGGYYVGSCEDIEVRKTRHNKGLVRATKSGVPWEIIYRESFLTRAEAVRRERQIKSYKGGEAFKKLTKK